MDFFVWKIKEQEFQNYFCRSLPYFYTFPGSNQNVDAFLISQGQKQNKKDLV